MRRLHLFELEDQHWCPKLLRNYLTDHLRTFEEATQIYSVTLPIIERGLESASTRKVVDLCSGASGPWVSIINQVKNVEVTLTDLYPNKSSMEKVNARNNGQMWYLQESVDALNVKKNLSGLRTMFTSFHHFRPSAATKILEDAVNKKEPIAVFEFTERTFVNLFAYPMLALLAIFLVTPSIKPFKISRLVLTYIVPLLPIMAVWDGYVSNLRTYSADELGELLDNFDSSSFLWEKGSLKTSRVGINITYLLGRPKERVKENLKVDSEAKLVDVLTL